MLDLGHGWTEFLVAAFAEPSLADARALRQA
jgi:hypothetical protein